MPPYLLAAMAACDGAWEAPESMREIISSQPTLDKADGPVSATRTRIATRARQTMLLDQALLHERSTAHQKLTWLIEPTGRLNRIISDAQGVEIT
ncbi:MAG: peptidase M4 family protein, partial [Paeniglutamicibacter terrestris]